MPIDCEDIVVVNLQRAVHAAIDLAAHAVATEGYGLPDKLAANFILLEKEGVITSELAEKLRKMVGLRNIRVHESETIDPEIVEVLVSQRLGNLRELARRIVDHFGLTSDDVG